MKRFLQQLREKPEPVRKQILHGAMIVVGFLLILAWVATLGARTPKQAKEPIISDKELAPFALLKQDFKETAHTVSAGLKTLRPSADVQAADTAE